MTFNHGELRLRHSQEWLGDAWVQMKERPDVVTSIVSLLEKKQVLGETCHDIPEQVTVFEREQVRKVESGQGDSCQDSECGKDVRANKLEAVPDLSKDDLLAQLKWKSSRKRRRSSGSSVQKMHYIVANNNGSPDAVLSRTCERFLLPPSLKVDHENCKFAGDSLFSSSVVPHLTSLVMSR